MSHVLWVFCWPGYYYEKMEKESNPFLILTLVAASKWSDIQALVSAEVPEEPTTGGKAQPSSFLLLLCLKKYTSKGSNLKLSSNQQRRLGWVLYLECCPQSPFQSHKGAKQLLANSNSSGMKYSDSWLHLQLPFVIDRLSFLGVNIWFLLDRNTQSALLFGI